MFRMIPYLTAPAFVVLMSGVAHAALTADQVWQSWKNAGALAGLTVSAATENTDGGVLTLNGVSITPTGGTGGVTISDMVLTGLADGSVVIVPGADIGADMTAAGGSGSVKLAHDGLTLTAKEGNGGALVYDYVAASLTVAYGSNYPGMAGLDGGEAKPATATGTVGFTDLAGSYTDRPGSNRTFGLDLTAGTLAYDTFNDDPGMELKSTTVSETADVALSVDVALPTTISLMQIVSPTDFGTALQEGLSISMTSRQGASEGSVRQDSPLFQMDMAITAGDGDATMQFSKDGFAVQSQGDGLTLTMTSGAMPVPVTIAAGPVAVAMTSPVMAGEKAGDFGLKVKLSQFTVNEEAWAMIDPGAALKRDPADLSIDVSGRTRIDFVAMAAAGEAGGPPVMPEPESLTITDLTLKVAGAAFRGTGAFAFDNSMGVPMPLGEADVSVLGGNALIDGLIATGMITEDDAMGARMMMGAFMSPGASPDELTSKIEAKAGGEIYVNGQRVQ